MLFTRKESSLEAVEKAAKHAPEAEVGPPQRI